MKVLGVLPFARELISNAVQQGDIVIDGTTGNGHDTLYLSNLVGELGHVYGFDIQEAAINKTKQRLTEHNCLSRVTLFQKGHEMVKTVIPEQHQGEIASAIFNLGYLPGGDKEIVTIPETTIMAISDIFSMLKKEGIIVLVVYHGHKEGKKEKDELLHFVSNMDQAKAHVLTYQFLNQKNDPPFIIAIEKR
ncbi:16S rRNA (cytosine(1402)-N(4))-methyltransferase [Anaerobacillus alkalilacustris]|uniref:16S rRNA (Cytosine(1402)-N(4))-methyltransferase n=1 Tax=Anaerobacillus alkalilacustris TaxID=393763 RepID=A0A1S2LM42_9BACI|nr:class I SAM-dependent methyltransferase [Anaerobacillus alkalilacustris]OIJ12485.1 16S rRNA (cytosine(1402)-N(4))-methyltransferase [Anaerobacillus alkalilacustris]